MGYGTIPFIGKFCLPNMDKLPDGLGSEIDFDNIIGSFGVDDIQEYYNDIMVAKWAYLYATLTCLAVAIIYNVILKFFAKPLIWISIIATGIGILALALFLQNYHNNKYVGDGQVERSTAADLL